MGEIPKAVVARLIRSAGAYRVSSGAVESMTEVLENFEEYLVKERKRDGESKIRLRK